MDDTENLMGIALTLFAVGLGLFVYGMALKFIKSLPRPQRPGEAGNARAQGRPAADNIEPALVDKAVMYQKNIRAINLTDTCPICLNLYVEGDGGISVLPCGHGLHEKCWLTMVNVGSTARAVTCPLCRDPVLQA